jgi:hypothetical protein
MNKNIFPIAAGPRLCGLCASGAVLRGYPRLQPRETLELQVICLFLDRVIDLDVTECDRFTDRFPPDSSATAQAPNRAWVA